VALPATQWYVNFGDGSTTGYFAVAKFTASHAYIVGQLIRQLTAPAVGSERVFVCILGGTSGAEPTWTITRGAKNTSTTPVFQECTGQAGVNGDITNTPAWLAVKATAVALGAIIKDAAGTHLFIASTAGTAGSGAEPSWSIGTVGNTTADNTVTWTYIGLASSFSGGAAPHARLANALTATWSQGTETIYVGDNHAETQSTAITLTGSSSIVLASQNILCHDHLGSYPPASSDLTTGASITSSSGAITWSAPNIYVRGIESKHTGTTSIGIMLGNGTNCYQRFELCPITFTSTSQFLAIGTTGASRNSRVIQDNCTFTFTGQQIQTNNIYEWEWRNSAFVGTAFASATGLILGGACSSVWVHGVDLSVITTTLMSSASNSYVLLDRCKINASATIANPSQSNSATLVLSKCDSGSVNYRDELYTPGGTLTTETTVVRTGGQSDGTTAISRKVVTGTNVTWVAPFEGFPIVVWNETVGTPVTITLYGIWGDGAVPNNDDFWIDVEYLGTSADPIFVARDGHEGRRARIKCRT